MRPDLQIYILSPSPYNDLTSKSPDVPPQPPWSAPGPLQLTQEAQGEGGAQGRRVFQEPLPHLQAVRRQPPQVGNTVCYIVNMCYIST